MKRVLIVADIRFPLERANGVQVVKTAAALARTGRAVTLVVRQSDMRSTDDVLALYGLMRDPQLDVRRLEVGHRAGAFRIPRARFLLRAGAEALGVLRAGDLVFTRDLQFADLLLRFKSSARLVYEAHALEELMYRERGRLYATDERVDERKARRIAAREARVWKGAAGIVTTTAGIRDSFVEQHGARTRVSVIANGCDVPSDTSFPGLAQNAEPRLVYAGQLYPWKGVDVLVEALTHVPNARLSILGGVSGEKDTARVAGAVDARGLAARVEFLGTVPQARVADELRRADVVAVPFLATGMTERHTSPLKAFEAMAAGRPIVISDLPSSREVLRDGESALLVPAGDAAALGAAIRRVLEDRTLAERLARQAFRAAFQYSWDARASALSALFEDLS